MPSKLPPLRIGKHEARYPIIQGGMGVRVSGAHLASAVANEGGIGVVASVALSLNSPYYSEKRDYFKGNKRALADELQLAREKSPDGIIGVNCMVAISDYKHMVQTACANGADVIISGAGLPLRLPEYAADYPDVALVPIVSSLKAGQLLIRRWYKSYGRAPDALVVEDTSKAGGHLGASREEVDKPEFTLPEAVPALVDYIEREWNGEIPVIAAGGIWDRGDIDWAMDELGAGGVQMASRFICTEECDASDTFKQQYLEATEGDIDLIDSPAGLPGRILTNPLSRDVAGPREDVPMECIAHCLTKCGCRENETNFCIATVLDKAQQGDAVYGLHFAGTNAYRHTHMTTVHDIFQELTRDEEESAVAVSAGAEETA